MEWIPQSPFRQVMADGGEAIFTVPGDVGSFRHEDHVGVTLTDGVHSVVARTRGAP